MARLGTVRVTVIDADDVSRRELVQSLADCAEVQVVGSHPWLSSPAAPVEPPPRTAAESDPAEPVRTGPEILLVVADDAADDDYLSWVEERHEAVLVVLIPEPDAGARRRLIHSGVRGLLPRSATPSMLEAALRAVHEGLVVGLAAPAGTGHDAPPTTPLERTRQRTWQRLAEGRTNAEIAAELFVSESTVKHQVSALMRRLGVRNRVELANLFWQRPVRPTLDSASLTATLDR